MRCSLCLHSLHARCFQSWVKWVFVFHRTLWKASYALMRAATRKNHKMNDVRLWVCVRTLPENDDGMIQHLWRLSNYLLHFCACILSSVGVLLLSNKMCTKLNIILLLCSAAEYFPGVRITAGKCQVLFRGWAFSNQTRTNPSQKKQR